MQRAVFALFLATAAVAAPADLWQTLMHGNANYVHGKLLYQHLDRQRDATAAHQHPPVTVLSCADSRVPPELMFDQSVGDLFVIRVAGNVVDPFGLASIEYAIAKGYTKLIVVIGHENCGAVQAALSDDPPGSPSLEALVAKIRKNLDDKKPPVKEAVQMNARATAHELVADSDIVRKAVADGRVKIVTAYYSFDGKVRRLE
jgi:carbonic anhydrase